MSVEQATVAHTISTQPPGETHLHGRRFLFSRIDWLVLVGAVLVVFCAGLPDYIAQLQILCTTDNCSQGQITPQNLVALQHFHISLQNYATFSTSLILFSTLVWLLAGIGLYWCKPHDWMVWLIPLLFILQGTNNVMSTLETGSSLWRIPAHIFDLLNSLSLFFVFALFPSGRFAPRWIRWLALVWVGVNALQFCAPFLTCRH